MVRRSTVDRSPHSAEHPLDYEPVAGYDGPEQSTRRRQGRGWAGGGGRWLIWVFRVVAWAVLLLIGYRGVQAIVTGETQSPQPAPAPSASPATAAFPVTLADAYALQFGQVYLNFSPAAADQRASQLAAFLPAGADPELGWNGTGSQQLQSEEVAGNDVSDAHHAVVTLLARVNGQLIELGVPVYATSAGVVISGEPALLPAPGPVSVPTASPASPDAATQGILTTQLPAFFEAYASGNQATLGRFLAPGASLAGLNGAVTFHSLGAVSVPPGGATRNIIATVTWNIPAGDGQGKGGGASAQLEMTYALTVLKQNGTWYVEDINAATSVPGPP